MNDGPTPEQVDAVHRLKEEFPGGVVVVGIHSEGTFLAHSVEDGTWSRIMTQVLVGVCRDGGYTPAEVAAYLQSAEFLSLLSKETRMFDTQPGGRN